MPKRTQKDQCEIPARKRPSRTSKALEDPAPEARKPPARPSKAVQDPAADARVPRSRISKYPTPDGFVRPPPGTDSCLWKANGVLDPFPAGGKKDLHRPLDQYLNIDESRFKPIGWGPEDLQTRNTIYYLMGTREAWKKKGRVSRSDFNDVSRLLYCRTQKLISGKSCLEVWIQGRKQLREMLRISIEELELNSEETETYLMETLPSYAYLKFARELFHEYEIELRVKFLGDASDVDEELIKKIEEEDDIRFEDEEESSDAIPDVAPDLQQNVGNAEGIARMEEEDPEEGRDTSEFAGLASPAHSALPASSSPDHHEDGGDNLQDVPEQEFEYNPDYDSERSEEQDTTRIDKGPEEIMETSDLAGFAPMGHQQDDSVSGPALPASSSPVHQEDGEDDVPEQDFEFNTDYDFERIEERVDKDPEETSDTRKKKKVLYCFRDLAGHDPQAHQQNEEVELDHQADVISSASSPTSSSPAHQEYEGDSQDNVEYDEDEYDFEIGFREPSTSFIPADMSRSCAPRQDHQEDNDFDFETDYDAPTTSSRPAGTSRAHGDSFFGSMDKVPHPSCSSTRRHAQTPFHHEGTSRDSEEGEEDEDDAQDLDDIAAPSSSRHPTAPICDAQDDHEEDRDRADHITLRFRRFLKKHPKLVDDQMFNEIYAMAQTGSTVSGDMKKRFADSALTGRMIEMSVRMNNHNQLRSAPGFVKDPIQREDIRNVPRKTLKEYQEKLEETRKLRKNKKEEFLDRRHRTILFDCIRRTPSVWRTRTTPAPASEWEKVGVKLYEKTGQAYSVERMRRAWRDAKTNMYKTLEKKKGKSPVQREEEMWRCYSHLLWYRIYKEGEDELSGQIEAEEQEASQETKDWIEELEMKDKIEFEAYRRGDREPEELPHFPLIPDHMRFEEEKLQTAQAMEYPEEFDENDRVLRDTILQPLLSCQGQEGKILIQRAFLFYLVGLDGGLNGPPSYRFDQLRKNVIN